MWCTCYLLGVEMKHEVFIWCREGNIGWCMCCGMWYTFFLLGVGMINKKFICYGEGNIGQCMCCGMWYAICQVYLHINTCSSYDFPPAFNTSIIDGQICSYRCVCKDFTFNFYFIFQQILSVFNEVAVNSKTFFCIVC